MVEIAWWKILIGMLPALIGVPLGVLFMTHTKFGQKVTDRHIQGVLRLAGVLTGKKDVEKVDVPRPKAGPVLLLLLVGFVMMSLALAFFFPEIYAPLIQPGSDAPQPTASASKGRV